MRFELVNEKKCFKKQKILIKEIKKSFKAIEKQQKTQKMQKHKIIKQKIAIQKKPI